MFHSFINILDNFSKRAVALGTYLLDFKIISISIIYVISDIFGLILLRNIGQEISVKYLIPIWGGILVVFIILKILGNILEKSRIGKKARNVCSKLLLFMAISNIALLVCILSITRLTPLISQEKKLTKMATSFTDLNRIFEGLVVSEITEKHAYDTVEVKLMEDINLNGHVLDHEGQKLLVKIKKYEKVKIGNVCNINGIFKLPENFEDFNYKDYLVNNNIYLIMEFPQIECSGERKGLILQNILVDFKQNLNKTISENLKEPQSSLLMGIIFGQDRLFSKKFDANVRMAGVSHIVAASGYNITILILAGSKILKFLPLKLKLFLLLILIWGFCILSGLSSSITRACIMTSISLVGMLLGRKNTVHITLPLACFIFVLVDPKVVFNIGFQLSVIATLGLIYLQPTFNNISKKIFGKSIPFLDDTLFPTLSCTLTTLPITIYTFKTLSIWAVIANCLILPVIETTMFLGILGVTFSKFVSLLSAIFFEVANVQLKYFELVVNIIGKIGWGYWEVGSVREIAPIVITIFLILLCIYFYPVENEINNYYFKISN